MTKVGTRALDHLSPLTFIGTISAPERGTVSTVSGGILSLPEIIAERKYTALSGIGDNGLFIRRCRHG